MKTIQQKVTVLFIFAMISVMLLSACNAGYTVAAVSNAPENASPVSTREDDISPPETFRKRYTG